MLAFVKVVEISNLVFSIIFSVEMLLKLGAYGFVKAFIALTAIMSNSTGCSYCILPLFLVIASKRLINSAEYTLYFNSPLVVMHFGTFLTINVMKQYVSDGFNVFDGFIVILRYVFMNEFTKSYIYTYMYKSTDKYSE